MHFIDSHAHIDNKRLDAESIIATMHCKNLSKILTVGFDVESSCNAVRLAANNENIYAAVGIHPSDVKGLKESDFEKIIALSKEKKVVAIGEFGLDYHYEGYSKEEQQYWCERQIELVKESNLPAIIHLRDAYEDMQKIISLKRDYFTASAVMHCFSGSLETALFYISLGFYISFSGVITYPSATKFAPIIRAIPRDKILIETDCPYLAPQSKRGKTNQPEYVRYVAAKIADILGEPIEYVAELTATNAEKLFNLKSFSG